MMTSEQARQEYDPYQDGYNYLDDYDDYYYDYMGYWPPKPGNPFTFTPSAKRRLSENKEAVLWINTYPVDADALKSVPTGNRWRRVE